MAFILSLESSGSVCSVALCRDTELIHTLEVHEENAHAAKLAVLVNEVLAVSGVERSELSAVAVSSGPGSYTGLRIGVSLAKGICYGLGIPLIAVPTLELLTYQLNSHFAEPTALCPMIDARRMEVYCMVTSANGDVLQDVAAVVVEQGTFDTLLQRGRVAFFGSGAEKCRAVITHSNAVFFSDIYPRAAGLCEIALRKWQANQFEDLASFEPFYLKGFVAKKPRVLL